METQPTVHEKNVAVAIHASTFLKYFIPTANFFVPLILWITNKEKPFIDHHGRNAINFQLSIFVYTLLIGFICLPFFILFATDFIALIDSLDHSISTIDFQDIKNLSGYILLFAIAGLLLFSLFVFELYAVITAALKASRGETYKYPMCIKFLTINPPKPITNEHTS